MASGTSGGIPWKRLADLAAPEVAPLSIGTVSLLIASGMSLAYPQAVKWMVDAVLETDDLSSLDGAAVALVAVFVLQAVFVAIRSWLFTVSGERVVARLRAELFGAILRQDVAFFDN